MEASSSPVGAGAWNPRISETPPVLGVPAGRPWCHVLPFTPSAFISARQALSPSWLGSFLHLPQTATQGPLTPYPAGLPLITRHVCSVSHSFMVFVE